MRNRNLSYNSDYQGNEPEFFMQIGFESIDKYLLSIAHRQLSNSGSGLIRHPLRWLDRGDPVGVRIINGKELRGVYVENKRDARLFHDSYEEHIEAFGLNKLEEGLEFVVISNGNLGNNFWHVAFESDKKKKIYCLKDEPVDSRSYSCFIVPKNLDKERPYIKKVKLQEYPDVSEPCEPPYPDGVFDENHNQLDVSWCTSGQQIVRSSGVVLIEEIIEEFYDVKHVFDLKDYGERKEEDIQIMRKLYEDYPRKFREKMLKMLGEGFPRAKYYHSTLGISENGIVIYHYKDKIEEIAKRLVDKGVKDAIILDQGGSVGVYASWLNSFLTKSSYFRPARISTIAFVLK